MQTLKSLIRPGHAEDDETLFGQGPTNTANVKTHHKDGLTGEGSHLTSSKESTNLPGQHGSGVPEGSNIHSTINTDVNTRHTGGLAGEGSHLAGSKQSTHLPGQETNEFSTAGSGGSYHTGPSGTAVGGLQESSTENRIDPSPNTSSTTGRADALNYDQKHDGHVGEAENHHGSAGKAAAGAVGLGAVGLGSQSHQNHPSNQESTSSTIGQSGNQSVPGSYPDSESVTGNETKSDFGALASKNEASQNFGEGSKNVSGFPDRAHTANDPASSVGKKEHHYGRDAAIVGGAAGLGGAAYGASKHSENKSLEPIHQSDTLKRDEPTVSGDNSAGAYGSAPQERSHAIMTSGTTSQATPGNPIDSHQTSNVPAESTTSKDHHYGKDAALGAGAVGAGYALGSQHGSQPRDASTAHTTTTDPRVDSNQSQAQNHGGDAAVIGGSTVGASQLQGKEATPHSSDTANRGVESNVSKDKDHNYGRDAAVVGGVGAAAYGAHKYGEHDDKEQKERDKQVKEAEKDRKHEHKEHDKSVAAAEKDRKHVEREHDKQIRDNDKLDEKDEKHAEKKHKGLFSFLHRDKNKKYSKEEEDEFDRQEREHHSNDGHKVAGAAAVAGSGAYVAHQSHSGHKSSVPDMQDSSTSASAQHKGSNTLVGAEKPVGSTIGDKLHGAERNRGVPGSTGFLQGGEPSDHINHHTGEKLAAGAGIGASAGALDHKHGERHSLTTGQNTDGLGNVTGSGSNTGNYSTTDQPRDTHTHGNEDNQTGAADVHETRHQPIEDSSAGQEGKFYSGGSTADNSHYAHGSATGAGHDQTYEPTSTVPRHLGSGNERDDLDSNTGLKTEQGLVAEENQTNLGQSNGRNRLRKDPPANRAAEGNY